MIALPDFTAAKHLKIVVEVGFVTGMMPAITPIGAPIAVTRAASSVHSTPIVRIFFIACAQNFALKRFLRILSS